MAHCPAGKDSWPELLGTYGNVAEAVIEQENSKVDAIVVKDGSFVSGDFRCDRVRVFVDDNGLVVRVPHIE